MKKTIVKICRILLVLILLSLLPISLSSCEYTGKEIASIEDVSTDYMGGIVTKNKLLLQTGEIYTSHNVPSNPENSYDYRIAFSYDPSLSDEIIDAFYSVGLFNLLPSYKSIFPVMDGGGWELIITYTDGTTKVSRGSNAGPYSTFQRAGLAFYEITGGDFLYAPSGEYKYAPSISLDTRYSDEANNAVYINGFFGISAYQGHWRDREMPVREGAIQNIEMLSGFDYTVHVYMQDYQDQFTHATVYAYKDSYENKKEVEIDIKTDFELTGIKRSFTFIPEPNTNYVIYLVFELGSAEYRLSTLPAQE